MSLEDLFSQFVCQQAAVQVHNEYYNVTNIELVLPQLTERYFREIPNHIDLSYM